MFLGSGANVNAQEVCTVLSIEICWFIKHETGDDISLILNSISMHHYASAIVISCTGGMYLISVMSPKDMQRPRASDANQTQPDWA